VATKNSAPVQKDSAKTTPNRRVKSPLKGKIKKKRRRELAFLSASLTVASRLVVISVGGMPVGAAGPRPRPTSIVGVHGYAPTSPVRCNLYGANSNAATAINGTIANFRWQVDILLATVPAGDYMAEVLVLDGGGVIQESTTFGLTLA
jgi:hypothetical protein